MQIKAEIQARRTTRVAAGLPPNSSKSKEEEEEPKEEKGEQLPEPMDVADLEKEEAEQPALGVQHDGDGVRLAQAEDMVEQ